MLINQKIIIYIFSNDLKISSEFYEDKMELKTLGGGQFMLEPISNILFQLVKINNEDKKTFSLSFGQKRYPMFSYPIGKNFLSYCKKLVEKGVVFDIAASYPGGYFSRIIDPSGNTFEVTCSSWEESDESIDPYKWDFFKSY